MTTAWPPIPTWEQTDLDNLSSSGQLSGLDPVVLGVIDSAESSGSGGGVNSEGYGGFFGLGESSEYPGGTTTPALLESSTSQSFEEQAVIAASAFNEYLTEAGGNPINAEEIYQSGSASGPTEGSKIMQEYLGGTGATSGIPNASTSATLTGATTTALNANPFDLFGIPQTVANSTAGAVWNEVGPFAVKAILVMAGLGVMVLGTWKLANPGESVGKAVSNAGKSAGDVAKIGAVAAA